MLIRADGCLGEDARLPGSRRAILRSWLWGKTRFTSIDMNGLEKYCNAARGHGMERNEMAEGWKISSVLFPPQLVLVFLPGVELCVLLLLLLREPRSFFDGLCCSSSASMLDFPSQGLFRPHPRSSAPIRSRNTSKALRKIRASPPSHHTTSLFPARALVLDP